MARITASVYTSHVPAIGAAIDFGKTAEPYWQPVFKGYEFSRAWIEGATGRTSSFSSTTIMRRPSAWT